MMTSKYLGILILRSQETPATREKYGAKLPSYIYAHSFLSFAGHFAKCGCSYMMCR